MNTPTKRNKSSHADRILRLARRSGVLRARDLGPLGLPRTYLARLTGKGLLERVGRGLYVPADSEATEHRDLAAVARRAPDGVVCLLSALQFHGLGTLAPFQVWLAIPPSARAPRSETPPLRIVRMEERVRSAGVEQHVLESVPVRIFGAARTVADCFKFRNKIGLDVALEALREFLRGRGNIDDLWRFAEVCRVSRVLRPYLEALAWPARGAILRRRYARDC